MSSPFDLTGRRVLVTGGARGIGRAIAIEFARAGAEVVIGVLDPTKAGWVEDEIALLGKQALVVRLDVTDLHEARNAIDHALESGPIDVLVNNAGGGIAGAAIDVTEADFDAVWALNTRSTFFLSQYVARAMPASGGLDHQHRVAGRTRRAARGVVVRHRQSGDHPHDPLSRRRMG